MKHILCAGLIGAALFQCGCQSMNWSANQKSSTKSALAQNENVREVPWSGNNKKKSSSSAELPPEIAAKFEKGKLKSKSAAEWVTEGARQETAHDLAAARKSYEAALSIDPDSADAHHRLGILADMRSDYGTAQEHYEAALRLKPRDPNLLSDIGYSNYLRGKAEQGERYLLQALEADSKHRQALKNLGTLYASQNRYEDALAAFRRCRPDEAQQLAAQYFPHGRPIPAGNEGQLASAQESATPQKETNGTVDQAALSRMSREEIYQLVGRLQQQNPPDRDQQFGAGPASSTDWPAISAKGAPRDSQGANPTNGADASVASADLPPATAQRNPKSEMPFWEGAARQPRATTPQGQRGNSSTNNELATRSRNIALPADLQPSLGEGDADGSWWSADAGAAANSGEKLPSAAPAENASWNVESTAPGAIAKNQTVKSNLPAARPSNGTTAPGNEQWAYQLGMSAGPGTLFPVLANYAPTSDPASDAAAGMTGNPRGGFPDARSAAPAGNFVPVDTDQRQWQTLPGETAPRSPAENGRSSTTVPWPDHNTTSQAPRGTAGRTAKSQSMPVITPGGSSAPWGNTAANTPRRSDATAVGNLSEGGNSNVVPAWYDVPASSQPISGRTLPTK